MAATAQRTYRNGRTRPVPPTKTREKRPFWSDFGKAFGYLAVARELAGDYLTDQAERVRIRTQRAVHEATNRIVAGIAVAAVMVTTIVLTIRGIAGGLTEAFGGRAWAGDLVTAAALAVAGFVAWTFVMAPKRSPRAARPKDDDEAF